MKQYFAIDYNSQYVVFYKLSRAPQDRLMIKYLIRVYFLDTIFQPWGDVKVFLSNAKKAKNIRPAQQLPDKPPDAPDKVRPKYSFNKKALQYKKKKKKIQDSALTVHCSAICFLYKISVINSS